MTSCNTNPTNPGCTCPTLGSFNIKKVKIPANSFGPNNPPNDRYFCSQATSMCQQNPNSINCACNSNATFHDCKCPSGKKYIIPYGTYAHFGRDYIYCCGDQSGAFDNICRQVGWKPSLVENIHPDERSVTTAAPKAIVSSTDEGHSVLGVETGQEIDVIKDVTFQKETQAGIEPAEVEILAVNPSTGSVTDRTTGAKYTIGTVNNDDDNIVVTSNKSGDSLGYVVTKGDNVEPTMDKTSSVVTDKNGTLAVSSDADDVTVAYTRGTAKPENVVGSASVYKTNDSPVEAEDDFPFHIVVPIVTGSIFLLIAIFLIWKFGN